MLRRALNAATIAIAIVITAPLAAQAPAGSTATGARVPLYTDLGSHHWAITTRHPDAQRYFDQGLRLAWAFNHEEAVRAFEEGEHLDPTCAMCAWGVAWALGPNINAGMDSAAGVRALAAVRRARERADQVSPRERALIAALSARYSSDPAAERAPLDSAWARALAPLADRYPADREIQVLHADALMNLSPWDYWNADGTPRPGTAVLVSRLEGVIAANPSHPGACHLFIHAVEAHEPARALPCAERLAALMPGAGHIVHMPGHIYIRVGRYEDAIRVNEHAVHADESYMRDQPQGTGAYIGMYYPHNFDFLSFAASMMGRREQAITAAERLVTIPSDDLLREPGMGFLQTHVTRHLQMKVRFGQWQAIREAPAPAADLPHARAMWNYALGRALTAQGDVAGARAALTELEAAVVQAERTPLQLEFNSSVALLTIAREVLAGHIAVRTGDPARAIEHLREAVRLEDALVYGEPPEWSVPVRQELGIVLLDAGRAADAEQLFREDLKQFPENGWSLQGLMRSLEAQGQHDEAARVRAALTRDRNGAHLPTEMTSVASAGAPARSGMANSHH